MRIIPLEFTALYIPVTGPYDEFRQTAVPKMHNCLTLVDYTWRDGEDSEMHSPTSQAREAAVRWRRITRSLDEQTSAVCGTATEDRVEPDSRPLARTSRSFRSDLSISNSTRTSGPTRIRNNSLLLLTGRQPPLYAASRRKARGSTQIWAPVGHCRYLLDRDPRTGEIQWSPESNEIVCSPRTLAEICMSRLVRDWPCMLPPRQPTLRNVISFLFSARETSATGQAHIEPHRRSASVAPRRHSEMSTSETKSEVTHEVHEPAKRMTYHDLPSNILQGVIGEAILQRDCAAIAGLIANWPDEQVVIRRLIPPEELPLSPSYLTKPSFVLVSPETDRGNRTTLVKGPSLLDAFILGLLTRQPVCKLTSIDFTGFEEDRRVSIELSRMPILWMKPENRNSETVRRHLMASLHIGIPRKRLEAYFARIASIYAIYESELGHGVPFEPVTVHLDCNMTVDEVALGLALQWLTPFRFSCNRLLLQRLPEIHFPPYSLIRLFDPLSITQFEMEDPALGSSLAVVLPSALGWLISLRNLRACSLPACIPPPPEFAPSHSTNRTTSVFPTQSTVISGTATGGPSVSTNAPTPTPAPAAPTASVAACRLLNRALISLRYLQRLGLARCHLTGHLKVLLNGLSQPLEYLNLQDCCLSPEDINYLVLQWRPLQGLYELNLSRNNLSKVSDETLLQLVRNVCLGPRGHLVCLSVAYTCLSIDRLVWFVGLIAGTEQSAQESTEDTNDNASDKWIESTSTLRVLCIQPFVPPSREDVHRLLYRVAKLTKLQRLHMFPAAYAFPARGEARQRELRLECISHSRNYLRQRLRADVDVL
ncbi:hypothetical protein D915_009364 [Fasciola hepatica]|uniref:Leucine-rich repeat-containing protein 14 n=1 Tax=Fasciola hepatica TaxID=6192 RepID=A0A4E0R7X8_FASHE|nr:hypothetical protein D915_009364 [Fasciola hepatica]